MRRHDIQDGTGIVTHLPQVGTTHIVSTTTPTNGQPGFAKSCIWQNVSGTAGTLVYVNTGTNTSATWSNII